MFNLTKPTLLCKLRLAMILQSGQGMSWSRNVPWSRNVGREMSSGQEVSQSRNGGQEMSVEKCPVEICRSTFPDSQDHLGEVQHQRHQGEGQEQGLRQRVNFWKNCINEGYSGLFRMIIMATLRKVFKTARTIWVKSSTKDTKV